MIKRILSALVMLIITIAALVGAPATIATAVTPSSIVLNDLAAMYIYANKDGSLNASGCSYGPTNKPAGVFIDESGAIRSTLPGSNAGYGCSYWNTSIGFESGLQFTTHYPSNGGPGSLIAWKNDRQLWSSTVPFATCTSSNSFVDPTNMAYGPDGNIYMLLEGNFGCDNFLHGVDPSNGNPVMNISLGAGPLPGVLQQSKRGLWLYDDKIMLIDRGAVVRKFDYTGVEDMSVHHLLPMPSGHHGSFVTANDNGDVFMTSTPSLGGDAPVLSYYKSDGSSGSISNNDSWPGLSELSITANGSVVGRLPYKLVHFDLQSGTVSSEFPTPLTTGYSTNRLDSYLEDANGNQLYLWHHQNANGSNKATSVEVVEASTSIRSRVFLKESIAGNPAYPSYEVLNLSTIVNSIQDGNLYLAYCMGTGCYLNSTPSSEIQKISLGSFGTPLGKGSQRNSYENDELEYVALGDSFSSGEGVEPFVVGSDTNSPSENRCHRSENAYPMLLDEDEDLNLNLKSFVACSGATTSNITTTGQWGEPAQINALSSTTDVVTLTIGGNDIGFVDFAEKCVSPLNAFALDEVCDEYTDIYSDVMSKVSNELPSKLESTFESVLSSAPNAEVYIAGYPLLAPYKSISDPFDNNCGGLYDETPNNWGDARAAYDVVTSLNEAIEDAISSVNVAESSTRLHFVDVSYGAFSGHDVCSNDSYFNGIDIFNREYSLHPNSNGQQAYREDFTEVLN